MEIGKLQSTLDYVSGRRNNGDGEKQCIKFNFRFYMKNFHNRFTFVSVLYKKNIQLWNVGVLWAKQQLVKVV